MPLLIPRVWKSIKQKIFWIYRQVHRTRVLSLPVTHASSGKTHLPKSLSSLTKIILRIAFPPSRRTGLALVELRSCRTIA